MLNKSIDPLEVNIKKTVSPLVTVTPSLNLTDASRFEWSKAATTVVNCYIETNLTSISTKVIERLMDENKKLILNIIKQCDNTLFLPCSKREINRLSGISMHYLRLLLPIWQEAGLIAYQNQHGVQLNMITLEQLCLITNEI